MLAPQGAGVVDLRPRFVPIAASYLAVVLSPTAACLSVVDLPNISAPQSARGDMVLLQVDFRGNVTQSDGGKR